MDASRDRITPQMVRNILNASNEKIVELCKKASLHPQKDSGGKTYFSKNDVEILKKVNDFHSQTVLASVPPDFAKKKIQTGMAKYTLLNNLEESIIAKLASVLDEKLDEKLDGMDEIVVELVRCKTENETLKFKLNELHKENYTLKNEISTYKNIGLGLYVKQSIDNRSY